MLLAAERCLMIVAMTALGWYAGIRLGAALDRSADASEFARLRAARPAAVRSGLIGRIEIPRLGVEAIVREGADGRTLRRAVGHIVDTSLPGTEGNVVLAGHRDTFFRPLKDVRRGDRIHLTTTNGTFTYVVRDARVVPPTDVSVLRPTAARTLTLVTCYPFHYIGPAPRRFVVRAEETQN